MPLVPPILAAAVEDEPVTAILALDPVAYWRMNDASGGLDNIGSLDSAKDAAENGSPAYQQDGIVPRSRFGTVEFDGTTDYFQVTDAVITGVDPEFSFGCWISTDNGLNSQTVFQQQDATSSYCGFRLITASGNLQFHSHHTNGTSQVMTIFGTSTMIQNGTPFYVGITADADNFSAYINGEFFAQLARTTVEYVSGSDCFIGRAEGAYRFWDGKISDLFICDYAMTHAEHYNVWRKGSTNIVRPRGDHFQDAPVLVLDETVALTTVGASEDVTTDPVSEYYGHTVLHKSVWCKFVPPEPVPYILRVDSTPGSSRHTTYVYVGDDDLISPADWNEYSNVESILNSLDNEVRAINDGTPLADGQAFYICVGLQNAYTQNPGPFEITIESFPDPPANDLFANAETIDVSSSGSDTGSTTGAGIENSQEAVMTGCAEHSVWYKFTANATGDITIDFTGTDSYKYYGVAVWDATAQGIASVADVDWTSPLAADNNDDTGNGTITFSVVSGNVYYFHITQAEALQVDYTVAWTTIS